MYFKLIIKYIFDFYKFKMNDKLLKKIQNVMIQSILLLIFLYFN
jgi:hypothetical protein